MVNEKTTTENGASSDVLFQQVGEFLLIGLAFGLLIGFMIAVNRIWKSKEISDPSQRYVRLIVLSLVAVFGVILIILLLPGKKASIDHVVTLFGVFLSGAIALSSTTFISNFMAGIMLSRIGNFNPGDFLSVGEDIGRVTRMGLLHTEIQTEHSNLTTFPNLYLVTNPCKVVRKKKTVVSAMVSLGYDVPHVKIKELLVQAAEKVPLQDPFVHIMELGDFSVTYRASGILENARRLISTRSKLREEMLDALHGAGIEIVSPTFMNTRPLGVHTQVLSPADESEQEVEQPGPESIIFDKAEEAESIENIRKRHEALQSEVDTIKAKVKELKGKEEAKHLENELRWRKSSIEFLERRIEAANRSDS